MKIRKAVIPAAGFGTRFLPATKAMPKEMLPIIDKPAIQYIVEEAVNSGIEEILIITGRGKIEIEDYFDKSFEVEEVLKRKGKLDLLNMLEKIDNLADIHYLRQKEMLGLGHAVLKAKSFVGDEPFVVLLGDDLVRSKTPCTKDLINSAEKLQSSVIAVEEIPMEKVSSYGVVDADPVGDRLYKIKDLVEKPKVEEAPSNLAILGRYVLMPEIFSYLEKTKPGRNNEIQLTDALRAMNKEHSMYAKRINGKWLTVGNKVEYFKTLLEFAKDSPDLMQVLKDFNKENDF